MTKIEKYNYNDKIKNSYDLRFEDFCVLWLWCFCRFCVVIRNSGADEILQESHTNIKRIMYAH